MQPTFCRAAREGAPRAVLSVAWHFTQKSAQNFVDYYLLTFPDKYGIIYMSRGKGGCKSGRNSARITKGFLYCNRVKTSSKVF